MRDIINLTPDLVACIGAVHGGAPERYREEKVKRSAAVRGVDAADAELASRAGEAEIRVAEPESLPRLHAQQRDAIAGLIGCALGYVDGAYPLLEGEQVVDDLATYLTEPYRHFPAGTAVIRRTTNMAELYYLIGNVVVDERGGLTRVSPSGGAVQRRRAGLKAGGGALGPQIAAKFATGLAGAIGGVIGGWIMEELFPPGVPSYFDEVYEQIGKIVGKELDRSTISTVNGSINAVKDHLITEYQPARRRADLSNRKDRKALYDLLQKYDTTFLSGPGGMLGTLQDERYAVPGFGVFLLGASVQLALFQEMANVAPQPDPAGGWLEPRSTSYGMPRTGTVALTAKRFADYVDATWPKVLAARVQNIHVVTYEYDKFIAGGDVVWKKGGAIDDGGERKMHRQIEKSADKDGSYPSRDQLDRDKDRYVDEVKANLTATYSDPRAIASSWRRLVDQPIVADPRRVVPPPTA